jgi:transcriptional regulator with XRE-family HTH domain
LQEYGDWVASERAKKSLTRAQLAERAGVSVPAVYNIETGRTSPQAATRKKLEAALNQKPPSDLVKAVQREAEIEGVGRFEGFDPHDEAEWPSEPGVYVFYDISDRPIYVGESGDVKKRIKSDHQERFWYKRPIVESASYVRVADQKLRRQLEDTLIKFLKSNAVINRRQVDRGDRS